MALKPSVVVVVVVVVVVELKKAPVKTGALA